MGYGDGKVDWSIQAPTLMPDPGAYQRGQNQGLAEIYEKGADELVETSKRWRALAVEVQKDHDNTGQNMYAWKEMAYYLKDNFAPHLTEDDMKKKYFEIRPEAGKRWYNDHVKDRTWDK